MSDAIVADRLLETVNWLRVALVAMVVGSAFCLPNVLALVVPPAGAAPDDGHTEYSYDLQLAASDGSTHGYNDSRNSVGDLRELSSFTDAARGTTATVRGGESAAAAYGRQIHRERVYGPGFRKEFTLASGRRPDAINLRTVR